MPSHGRLYNNLNLPPKRLKDRIAPFLDYEVYSYVVETVKYDGNLLYQTGSGPNFQGGMITLCSCKHRMRTARNAKSWKDIWIAGFISSDHVGEFCLFYLMMVSQVFESHREIWSSPTIPEATKTAKAAHLNRLGDIYKPRNNSKLEYSHRSYVIPCEEHVHRPFNLWHEDIGYKKGYSGRPSALLVGNPDLSFLWDEPLIPPPPFEVPRNCKTTKLAELFSLV